MKSLNLISLIGHIGQEPEIRYISDEKTVAKFSLATSEKYKDKDGNKVEHTDWHNIILWNRLADIVEKYVSKGNLIYLQGKIQYRSYDDGDGNKKFITEIIANSIILLEKNTKTQDQPQNSKSTETPPPDSEQESF